MTQAPPFVDSGLPAVGAIPWGSHFCHFYETKDDLAETLVLYFKRGLENEESCLWVTAEPFGTEDACAALRGAVPSFDRRAKAGQIEIVDYRDWYLRTEAKDAQAILQSWIRRKDEALRKGYSGLRLTGNAFWLEERNWQSFAEYEATVNRGFAGQRLTALCSYCLDRCKPAGILDVVRNHQFALVRRNGEWEVVEHAALKIAKTELMRLNAELERRADERTAELTRALADKDILFREMHHRVKNNLQIVYSLLQMKARRLADGDLQQALRQTLDRIRSMSLVHEVLYQRDDAARVDFSLYLCSLCRALAESYGEPQRIALSVSSEGGFLNLNQAVPLGLIANEVIANAYKHAFPGDRAGHIDVSFRERDGRFVLVVRDDGVGMRETTMERLRGEAGLALVQALAGQLDASLSIDCGRGGTRFEVAFPAQR